MGGMINLRRASAESDFKRNKWTYRHIPVARGVRKSEEQSDDMFHIFCWEIHQCFITMGVKEWPEAHAQNNKQLDAQRKEKRAKEKLMERKGMVRGQKKLIHSTYRFEMYNSDACVKGNPKNVTKMLNTLPSDAAKYRVLRANIEIRVDGFGGEFKKFAITWSTKGKRRTVKELADHLRKIIRAENNTDIPDKPPVDMPKRVDMKKLGDEWTDEVKKLNQKYFSKENTFRQDAEKLRQELEDKGEGSMYSLMQPWVIPELVELVEERIDVLSSFDVVVDNRKATPLRWCQGLVKSVVEDAREPTVVIEWDGMSDIEGWEGNERVHRFLNGICGTRTKRVR